MRVNTMSCGFVEISVETAIVPGAEHKALIMDQLKTKETSQLNGNSNAGFSSHNVRTYPQETGCFLSFCSLFEIETGISWNDCFQNKKFRTNKGWVGHVRHLDIRNTSPNVHDGTHGNEAKVLMASIRDRPQVRYRRKKDLDWGEWRVWQCLEEYVMECADHMPHIWNTKSYEGAQLKVTVMGFLGGTSILIAKSNKCWKARFLKCFADKTSMKSLRNFK